MSKKNTASKLTKDKSALWTRLNTQLSFKERLMFTKYLSVLLESGLPIDESVETLLEQSKKSLKVILTTLHEGLRRGESLSEGLMKYPHIFDLVYINLIRAGEESGTLQDNLKHLVVQMQKEYDLRRKIRGAMMYPLFIIGAAIALSIGIVVFILPNIKEVFAALQVDLPLPTRILLWVADTVTEHGVMTVLSALGVCVFFLILRKIPIVQPYLHRALMATPFLGSMSRRINVGRFSRLMGTMLQGGMPINQIFPVVRSVLKNKQYTLMFEEMESEVGHGESVSGVLKSYLFLVPPITLRMIHVGEQTGSLPEMLLYLADFYEREIDEITKNLATLLEPALLIFVGLLVGGLAISIMMPIYQVVGQF